MRELLKADIVVTMYSTLTSGGKGKKSAKRQLLLDEMKKITWGAG